MTTKVLYTVIIGNNYNLREIRKKCPGWKYYCITDQNIKSKTWEIRRVIKQDHLTDRQNSRIDKIYQTWDISMYIDSKFIPFYWDLDTYLERWLRGCDMTLLKHDQRKCIYEEGDFLINNNITDKGNLIKQLDRYIENDYPECNGLLVPNIMIRKNSKLMQQFQNFWWNEYIRSCERDMISLAYSLWKFPELKVRKLQFRRIYRRFSQERVCK